MDHCVSSTDSGTAPPLEPYEASRTGKGDADRCRWDTHGEAPVRQADGDAGKDNLDRPSRAHAAISAIIACSCATDVAYRLVSQFEFDCSRAKVGA
jgi:hypothetical protein